MMRMIPSMSPDHAKKYFSDALSKSDYYTDGQELQGRFYGRLRDRLGLGEDVTKEAFYALCENRNPKDGKRLTPHTKEKRITGYDCNFHVPKSVSILHVLGRDNHILDAFQKSVRDTMRDIEADSKTRVRKGGIYDDRETGELLWAEFIHQTARPVENYLPDPHLHAHCFIFNATWDAVEKKIKAGKFRDIKRDMPYYQARFQKRLADNLAELGYAIKKTPTSFEIEGVPKEIIKHFSKRTDQIGRVAKEKGIFDAKTKDQLGARTRSRKQKGHTMADLKAEWRKQMREISDTIEADMNQAIRSAVNSKDRQKDLSGWECIDHAKSHCFERASVVPKRKILEKAYNYALGRRSVSLDEISSAHENDYRILQVKQGGQVLCTTKEVLAEERLMVELAIQGRGKILPLHFMPPLLDLGFNEQQKSAISHVVTTCDRVSIVRGAAGTGKTKIMTEVKSLVERAGKRMIVVAPTAEASRGVLRNEGFADAETVAKLLTDEGFQKCLKGNMLWVDEAGLLGTKDMTALLELAKRYDAQVVLGGDTRQHSSVLRGDALRVLNTVGKIKSAEVSKIYRQRNSLYKEAVQDLSNGNIAAGFEKLDAMGAIQTIDILNPNNGLVNDYVAALQNKKSALVISPTHDHGDRVTSDIRDRLRLLKIIGEKETKTLRYVNLNFTEAERSDWRNYEPGQCVQFNQNHKGIKRGSIWSVSMANEKEVSIQDENDNIASLPLKKGQFDVLLKTNIGLSKGDQIKITRNGFDEEYNRLNSGMTLEVHSVGKDGKIYLRNRQSKKDFVLPTDYGHIQHAYCLTSHASQGKTVDEVFIAQPSSTFTATDAKQFYVSVSRGRDNVRIYTDDRETLLDHASRLGDRLSAIELVKKQKGHAKHLDMQDKQKIPAPAKTPQLRKNYTHNKSFLDRDYEPV